MKQRIGLLRMLTIAAFLLAFFSDLTAQQSTYVRQPGYWIFGLNGGFAYQDSDVPLLLKGWGAGATLGKNLYYAPDAPLSFDLRGRFLYSQTYGLDHKRSLGINRNNALNGQNELNYTTEGGGPGYVFQNHQTKQAELGLEGVFTLNQLRERHNVLFSIYGGLNLDWYRTQIDQRDFNGQYDDAYRNINTNRSTSSIRNDLRNNILDGDYETNAHDFSDAGKINFMPSLGVELGYQLTPTFSMGIGHKMTFARTDLLDGHQWLDNNNLTGDNDIHHYTSLHMRWDIQPKEKEIPAPLITITQPDFNPHTTGDPNALVRATIKHVNSAVDVNCTVNGRYLEFEFNGKNFSTRFILEPGSNEVLITARNSAGTDSKKQIIIFQEETYEPDPVNYPLVRFDNPPQDNYRVEEDRFTVRATIQEVENKNNVRFFVNNQEIRNFNFNAYNDDFSATVDLQNGRNTFRLEGTNAAGQDIAQTFVVFKEEIPLQAPTVNITRPARDYTERINERIQVRAVIRHVEYKNDIELRINGRTTTNFDWDASRSELFANVLLYQGQNVIRVIARNTAGEAEDQVLVRYELPVVETFPPRAEITAPRHLTEVTTETVRMIGRVERINNRNGVNLYLNGREVRDFSFRSGLVEANLRLIEGKNVIRLVATNIDGIDEDQVTVNYNVPAVYPQVRIQQPNNGSRFDQPTIDLQARVEYVENKRDVQVILNGRNQTFSFSRSRAEATARLTLQEGRNVIRVTGKNRAGNATDEVTVYYERPLERPTVNISRPADNSTVRSAGSNLSAITQYVGNKEDIKVYLNGRQMNTFTFFNGTISANLTLVEGQNTVRVTVKNASGSAEDQVRVTYQREIAKPTVRITRPANNSTVDQSNTRLNATIQNVEEARDIKVYVNGNSIRFEYRNDVVSANVDLETGRNAIRVVAQNVGGQAEDQVWITYQKPVNPPTVRITQPRPSRFATVVEEANQTVKAFITEVERKEDVGFFINGKAIRDFSFRNGQFSATIQLQNGKNTIKVTAENQAGKDEDQVTVTYRDPVTPPTVKITQPRPSRFATTVDEAQQIVKASITEVAQKEDVGFFINGKAIRDFSFTNGQFSATIQLQKGKNTIKVTGENSAGKDADQVTLTYVPPRPVLKPTVRISSPDGPVKKDKVNLKAQVTNVASKKEITVLLDGKAISNFDYNGKYRQVTASFKVEPGKHEVTVIAKNEGGEAQDSKKFSYADPKPPVVQPEINSFTNSAPVINPMRPNSARTTIRATLSGVSTKKEIQMSVNGKVFNRFTFNPQTGTLVAPITLVKGTNNILLKVTTAGGTVKKSKTIEF